MSGSEEYDESEKGLSMVLGIVGLVISCTPIGFVASLLAIIFAGVCINKKQGIRGFVITGLVLGIVSLAFWAVFIIVMILGFAATSAFVSPVVNSIATI